MKAIVLSAPSPARAPSLRGGFLLQKLLLLLICFALCQIARAVVPAPDGGYPGANTAEGTNALFSLTSGIDNTALGFQALYHNRTGNYNTAEGFRALFNNTHGAQNTATGVNALITNTTGNLNTATGVSALFRNTGGIRNTATGVQALFSNTTGSFNTANGLQALHSNTIGNNNTANGLQALFSNTVGTYNTANGLQALYSNTNGRYNTASGVNALLSNRTGDSNTACGLNALRNNTLGGSNTALGTEAGSNVTTANNVICIGISGDNQSNSCYIGNIFGATIDPGSGIVVGVDSNGKLGTTPSSKRFKEEIKPMDEASEALLALRPVTFRYKSHKESPQQFGLIAEEVAEINPDLVVRDKNGEIYTVRYDVVNAMLLNEFLKEHRRVEKLEATIEQQQKNFQSRLAEQEKKIEALTTGLQRVSAQLAAVSPSDGGLEMSKSAPKTVLNQ
jgi:trimeric autotransporter adhesin